MRLLDKSEATRLEQFVVPGPKRRFVLCRGALRSILCNVLGCDNADLQFPEGTNGKPFATVKGDCVSLEFNVSHSGDHGLIALRENHAVGIDIEIRRQRRDIELLVSTVMSPTEQAIFASFSDEQRRKFFFDYWTVKEAVLKATGFGLSGVDPSEIEVPRELRDGKSSCLTEFPALGPGKWRIETLGTQEFSAAIAFVIAS